MNELVLARALYRGALFALRAVALALALVGMQLEWVLVPVFAAAIVAAGMAPVVSRFTDPERTPFWRTRLPPALVVVLIYLGIGLLVLVLLLGSILLRVVVSQGPLLARVMDRAVKLNPLVVLVAVLVGHELNELDLDLEHASNGQLLPALQTR
jgi:hypothetical protein